MIAGLIVHPTQKILRDAIQVEDFNETPKLPPALAKARADCLEV
jgi:hypothetical protein